MFVPSLLATPTTDEEGQLQLQPAPRTLSQNKHLYYVRDDARSIHPSFQTYNYNIIIESLILDPQTLNSPSWWTPEPFHSVRLGQILVGKQQTWCICTLSPLLCLVHVTRYLTLLPQTHHFTAAKLTRTDTEMQSNEGVTNTNPLGTRVPVLMVFVLCLHVVEPLSLRSVVKHGFSFLVLLKITLPASVFIPGKKGEAM